MSVKTNNLDCLEETINYTFSDESVLVRALTHSSLKQKKNDPSYERLEFLGDRVLGLIVAEILIERFPSWTEGQLAPKLAFLVSGKTLVEVAKQLKLQNFVLMSEGEITAGTNFRDSILGDCCEALIGAIYSDGGMKAARAFIDTFWSKKFDASEPRAAKTELQEWAQGRGMPLPKYKVVDRQGPAHRPIFTVEASVIDCGVVRASGQSKQAAEQEAAAMLLEQVAPLG